MSNNKGILVSDFSWNTVICYAGINATTIAGYLIYKYSCCFSWTKWVGLAVAIAGSASAAYQIYLWYNKCEEIIGMVAFANNLEYIWNQGRFLLNASSLEDAIKWAAQYIKNNYPEIYNHGLDGKNVDWNKFLRDFFAYDQINNAISYIRNFNIDFGERLIVTAGSTGITRADRVAGAAERPAALLWVRELRPAFAGQGPVRMQSVNWRAGPRPGQC